MKKLLALAVLALVVIPAFAPEAHACGLKDKKGHVAEVEGAEDHAEF